MSSDHVTAAPNPLGDPQKLIRDFGVPSNVSVPENLKRTGKEFDWEALVVHEVAEYGTLRLWTRWWGYHADEDTLELSSLFHLRKVHQCMRHVGLRVEEAVADVDFLV